MWVEQLGEKDQRVLAMNRLSAKGEWNVDELKIESKELILADGPIEISGFTLDEIDQIVLGEADDAVEQGLLAPEAGAITVARLVDVLRSGCTASSAAADIVTGTVFTGHTQLCAGAGFQIPTS